MSPEEIEAWNRFVVAMLLFVVLLTALVWAMPGHCGADCETCRPRSARTHK